MWLCTKSPRALRRFLTQSRKGAKRCRVSTVFFAPLRGNLSLANVRKLSHKEAQKAQKIYARAFKQA
jgi:uncharacterized protein YhbP (UPF0306 family)